MDSKNAALVHFIVLKTELYQLIDKANVRPRLKDSPSAEEWLKPIKKKADKLFRADYHAHCAKRR